MLETIELPGSGRQTTRLGFGGSGLMGGLSERESSRLLETAFDAGIRHFDVAPSYGHGMAERCLGNFLRGKRDQVTIATKYGILPPRQRGLFDAARKAVRPIARTVPAVRKRLAYAAAALKTKAKFSAEEAARSLENSLRELSIDRIDLWLLHEATADDLDAPDLLAYLQSSQAQGRIGTFGLGTERKHVDTLWQKRREYCRVLQFECSAGAPAPVFPGAFCIHHGAVVGAANAIRESFDLDPQLCRRWSSEVDADLGEPNVLAALLLTTALAANPNGMVLFSSRVPAHIQQNVHVASAPAWAARSQRFVKLLRRPASALKQPVKA